jgi:hypothetical protein
MSIDVIVGGTNFLGRSFNGGLGRAGCVEPAAWRRIDRAANAATIPVCP